MEAVEAKLSLKAMILRSVLVYCSDGSLGFVCRRMISGSDSLLVSFTQIAEYLEAVLKDVRVARLPLMRLLRSG